MSAVIGDSLQDAVITSSTSAQDITALFSAANLNIAQFMTVTAHAGAILYRLTGNNPARASSQGHILNSGETITIVGENNISRFRFLTYTGSPLVYVTIHTAKLLA